MDQMAIVRRSWELLRRYKVLWLYGILVALTSGGGSSNGSSATSSFSGNGASMPFANAPWLADALRPERIGGLFALCCCLIVLLVIVAVIVNYVSRAALIRSADRIEETGVGPTWREGFRLGWTNRTFRLWLLDLIAGIIIFLAVLILLALAASPLLLLLTNTDAARVIGISLTVALGLVLIMALIILALFISVLREFWTREILLGDRGIGEAIGDAIAHMRGRARDVALLWLLMLGIGIIFGLVMIPVVLVLVALAGALGGGLGWAVYEVTQSTAWAVLLGLPLFLIVFMIPMALIGGLYTVFTHNAWTLGYRDVVRRRAPLAPVVDPEP